MTIYFESFDGPGTDLDWNIVRGSTSFTINGDGTASLNTGDNAFLRAVHDVGDTDMYAETVISQDGNGNSQRVVLILRSADDSDSFGYTCALDLDEEHLTFIHWVDGHPEDENGEYIPFGIIDDPVTIPTAPFTLRFEVEGTEFRGYINGELVKTENDSQRSYGTNGGLGTQRGATFESFETGALGDVSSPELSGNGAGESGTSGTASGSGVHVGSGAGSSSTSGAGTASTTHHGQGSAESVSDVSWTFSGTHTGRGSGSVSTAVSGSGKRVHRGSGESGTDGTGYGSGEHTGSGSGASVAEGVSVYSGEHHGDGSGSSSTGGNADGSGAHYGRGSGGSLSDGIGSGYARQFAAAGIARPIVGMTLRLIEPDGTPGEFLPDWTQVAFTDKYNATGTVAINYAKRGIRADELIRDRAEGALFDGSLEIPGTRFLVTQSATDAVKQDEAGNTVTLNCPVFVPTRLEQARVYPPGWPDTEIVKTRFAAMTPGEIIGSLIASAKSRGAILDIEQDFSATLTSAGTAWEQVVTLEVEPGGTILSVLQKLTEMGVCDWSSDGRTLIMLNADSGEDRTTQDEPVVLQAGRDILDAPEKRDSAGILTTVLVTGKDGLTVEVTDETLYESYGRLEGFVSVNGVDDEGTLRVIGEATLEKSKLPLVSYTHGLSLFANNGPVPWVDYGVGDYLFRDIGSGQAPERMRVAQLTGTYNKDKTVTGAITLGTRFDTLSQQLSARIDALTNGSSGEATAPANPPEEDRIAPQAPIGLLVTSEAYSVPESSGTLASVTATWSTPERNEDGSVYRDHGEYQVRYRRRQPPAHDDLPDVVVLGDVSPEVWDELLDLGWKGDPEDEQEALYRPHEGSVYRRWVVAGSTGSARETSFSWTLGSSLSIEVEVRAIDRYGNASPWSDTVEHLTSEDDVPPGQPTDPVLTVWLGTIRARWDGKAYDGQNVSMPTDFREVQVHCSIDPGAEESDATFEGILTGESTWNINGLEMGTTYYVWFVARDFSGNLSERSERVSAVPRNIVNLDFGDEPVVDSQNIINAAIMSAHIDEAQINEAHIDSVNAGSIRAGTMIADVTVSGHFQTETSEDRPHDWVRMDSSGIRMQYDGEITVDINKDTGAAFFTGQYQTAIDRDAGERFVINPDGSHPNEMRAYAWDGINYGSIKVIGSGSTSYPGSAGISMKGFSTRTDNASGEVSAFPNYASLAFANENESGGIVHSRIGVEQHQATMAAGRVHIGYSSVARIGISNGGSFDARRTFKFDAGGNEGLPRIMSDSPNGNVGWMFVDNAASGGPALSAVDEQNSTQYVRVVASNVGNGSSRSLKTDIRDLEFDPIEAVRKAPSQHWMYKSEAAKGTGGWEILHLSPMADDLPEEILIPHQDGTYEVKYFDMVGLLWEAVRHLILERNDSNDSKDTS